MTEGAFEARIAELSGVSESDVNKVINAQKQAIVEAALLGDGVAIHRSMKVTGQLKPARTARNPRNGEEVQLPERWFVNIKESKWINTKLKEAAEEGITNPSSIIDSMFA